MSGLWQKSLIIVIIMKKSAGQIQQMYNKENGRERERDEIAIEKNK